RLMSVVFPAPFGPMSPNTCPSGIARSTAFTATTPPKRFVSAVTSSNIFDSDGPKARGAPQIEERRETARQIDDDEHEDRALEDVAVFLQRLEDRGQRREQDRTEDRPDDVRDAADDREHEELDCARETAPV